MVARPAVKNEGQKIEITFKVIGDVPVDEPGEMTVCSGVLDIMVVLDVSCIKEK